MHTLLGPSLILGIFLALHCLRCAVPRLFTGPVPAPLWLLGYCIREALIRLGIAGLALGFIGAGLVGLRVLVGR